MSTVEFVQAFVPQAPLSALVLSFLLYSFAGWLWESTACGLMNRGHFVNSGFLLGPVCPVYGTGAVACWLALRDIDQVPALFVASGCLACGIEYLVSLALEHITGARFWNYEEKPLNINGRVCLYGFLFFGAGATLVCRVVQPWVNGLLGQVPGGVLRVVACALVALLAADLVFAMASWRRLSTRLEELRCEISLVLDDQMAEASERMIDRLPDEVVGRASEAYVRAKAVSDGVVTRLAERVSVPRAPSWLSTRAERLVGQLGKRDLRFFNAFPRMRFARYDEAISRVRLRDRVRELFDR